MSLDSILNYLSAFSGAIPLIAGLYCFKRLDRILKVAAIFFVVSSFFDVLLSAIPYFGLKNNSPFIHLFLLISLAFYGWVYYNALKIPLLQKITVALSIVVLVVIIYCSIANGGLMSFPTISYTSLSLLLNVLSLLFFYQLLNNAEFVHIEKLPMFWFNSAVIFYFGINIFLFMLFERIVKHHGGDLWLIHDVTNIIANILYSVALICKPQKT